MDEYQKTLNKEGDYCFSVGAEFPEITPDDHNIYFHIMNCTLHMYQDGEWKFITYT